MSRYKQVVRLAKIALTEPLSDISDRSVMPMSTVIANEQWMVEAAWDGVSIGDPQVFLNRAFTAAGTRILDDAGEPVPDDWRWWAGVPHAKLKSYWFHDADFLRPQTLRSGDGVDDDKPPFKLSDGERKAEPGQARSGGTPPA